MVGRKRAICRGEVQLPLDGPHSINEYRSQWGLPPITERGAAPIVSQKAMTFFQKARSFVRTVSKTLLSHKLSDQTIIDQRLAICQTCPQFENGGCKLCGCRINRAKTLTNKIANLSATCPAKPPRWGAAE
jgi:hypothetical protein